MRRSIYQRLFALFLLVSMLTACGTSAPIPDRTAIQSISNADDIAAMVQVEVETQLAAQNQTVPVASNLQPELSLDLEATLTQLYGQANPTVVYITIPPAGGGSGFVYSDDGYIVTNSHVVSRGQSYEVLFANGERRSARLVGQDVDSDLAVLKVDALPPGISALPLADPDSIQVGHFAVAIGNPFGEQGSMSLGIISGLGRSLPSQRDILSGSTYSLPEVIQTDAPINPGNSGGPLLNLAGEVVGVNSAIASTTGIGSGVGFSIPVAAVQQIVPSLIASGTYDYAYIGAGFDSEITLDEESIYGLLQNRGAYVINVTPGSPAAQAGLIAANPNSGQGGDLIIAIDGQAIADFADLNSYLVFNTQVGQTIQLTVLRNGETITVPLTLGRRL